MSKKSKFIQLIFTACLTLSVLTSCQSHEQKADDAFETVKKEKLFPTDSNSVVKEIIEEPKKTEVIKKSETEDPWIKFKMEIEKKIVSNENKIKEIKSIPNADTKLLKKATNLEKDNNDLRKQMDEYNEETKMKWENFKTTMNHDVDEIGIELKDITLNNKK